jgi:site-specific recombinase XerC
MTRAEQINKAVEEIFNNADIAIEDRAMLRMWYSMGAKFADDNPKDEVNWQQVHIQAAIAAMQGFCANPNYFKLNSGATIPEAAIVYSDDLIEKLKGE